MKTIITLVAVVISVATFGQTGILQVSELTNLTDQFKHNFDPKPFGNKVTLLYIPGNDDPWTKVYDKWKGKNLKKNSNVQVAGGFKEMLAASGHGGSAAAELKNHVAEAMIYRYGKDHFPILIDMESKIASQLNLTGYSIIQLDLKSGKVESIIDFGSKRKEFFEAISVYFN